MPSVDRGVLAGLQKLFGNGKRKIAVYTDPTTGKVEFMPIWTEDRPPLTHKFHPTHTFAGMLDITTGHYGAKPTEPKLAPPVIGQIEQIPEVPQNRTERMSGTLSMILLAILAVAGSALLAIAEGMTGQRSGRSRAWS